MKPQKVAENLWNKREKYIAEIITGFGFLVIFYDFVSLFSNVTSRPDHEVFI